MSTSKQLQCMGQGGPLELKNIPTPTPGSDEVLIHQKVIALNALDWKQRDFSVNIKSWPHVLGIEGAGIIEAVGSDVKTVKVGDEVIAWEAGLAHFEHWGGAYQEHVIVPARFVAKRPKNMSLEEAASLPICYNTAVCAIHADLKIPLPFLPNTSTSGPIPKSILILGGGSAVGAAAIQLLRLAHPSLPILATSSPKHNERLTSLGATKLVDYKSSTVAADVKAASPGGRGVDMIVDCVGASAKQTDIYDALDPTGAKAFAAIITGAPVRVPEGVTGYESSGWALMTLQGRDDIVQALTTIVEEGKYKLPVPVRVVAHGLEKVPKAVDLTKSTSGEKLVVTV